jgi:hypothetical protein
VAFLSDSDEALSDYEQQSVSSSEPHPRYALSLTNLPLGPALGSFNTVLERIAASIRLSKANASQHVYSKQVSGPLATEVVVSIEWRIEKVGWIILV